MEIGVHGSHGTHHAPMILAMEASKVAVEHATIQNHSMVGEHALDLHINTVPVVVFFALVCVSFGLLCQTY